MYMRVVVSIFFFVLLCWESHAQSGVNFRFGVGTMNSNVESFTLDGQAHYGWRAGAFARIGASGSLYFNPGLFYGNYKVLSSESLNSFGSEPSMHFINGLVDLGLFLIKTDAFRLRLEAGGNINYLAAIDNNDPGHDLNTFNDATLGVNGGLGIDIWFLTADISYEHSLTKFINESDESDSRFWSLAIGFFF